MSIHTLKPWTELVKLHPDVESRSLADGAYWVRRRRMPRSCSARRPAGRR